MADNQNPSKASEKREERSSTPKKRLMLSHTAKEKLLNWDVLVAPEETVTDSKITHQHKDQVEFINVPI